MCEVYGFPPLFSQVTDFCFSMVMFSFLLYIWILCYYQAVKMQIILYILPSAITFWNWKWVTTCVYVFNGKTARTAYLQNTPQGGTKVTNKFPFVIPRFAVSHPLYFLLATIQHLYKMLECKQRHIKHWILINTDIFI